LSGYSICPENVILACPVTSATRRGGNPSFEKHIAETKQTEERFQTSRNDRQGFMPLLLYLPQEGLKKLFYKGNLRGITYSSFTFTL
jgi:hypothetical protein